MFVINNALASNSDDPPNYEHLQDLLLEVAGREYTQAPTQASTKGQVESDLREAKPVPLLVVRKFFSLGGILRSCPFAGGGKLKSPRRRRRRRLSNSWTGAHSTSERIR